MTRHTARHNSRPESTWDCGKWDWLCVCRCAPTVAPSLPSSLTLKQALSVGGIKVVGGVHFWVALANSSGSCPQTESGRGGPKVVGGSSCVPFGLVFPLDVSDRGGSGVNRTSSRKW